MLRGSYWWEGEGKGGWIWLMYFLHMYEYGTMKYLGAFLRRGGRGRKMEGWTKPGYVIHIYENVTESTVQLLYTNKNIKKCIKSYILTIL
jgi:hypothetical protein